MNNLEHTARILQKAMLKDCKGYTCPTREKELYQYNLIQSLIDYDYALALSDQGYNLKSHMKIDNNLSGISEIFNTKQLGVCGMYSHLCVSDSLLPNDVEYTHTQINPFLKFNRKVVGKRDKPWQSSYGLLNYPELQCDYVRAGIALYGDRMVQLGY